MSDQRVYLVTIRYQRKVPQYEVFEVEAENLREALFAAGDRFGDSMAESGDLIEIREGSG